MTIDPEELRQRRQQRKKKKNKKTVIRLAVLGAVLLLVILLIVAAGGKKKSADVETVDEADLTVIRLAAAGDLNVTQSVVDSGGEEFDYTKTLMDVLPLLGDADISVVNFEGNLNDAPYGDSRSAPQSLIKALERAGVDLVQIANSYAIYQGMDGLARTIQGIRMAGMEPVGAYETRKEAQARKGYTIQVVEDVKIAFVAFTKGMDGMALPAGNEGCVNVLYKDYATDYQVVDTSGINQVLSNVRKEKPDLTVALVHWGSEFKDDVSTSQEKIRKLLLDGGVDVILGTHPHFLQQMEYDAKKGTFVAWSLGDFMGDARRAGSEYSVVLELEITKNNKTGKTRVTGYSYTPIFTVNEEGRPLQVVRIQEAMRAYEQGYIEKVSQATYEAMEYALERIEARIHGKK